MRQVEFYTETVLKEDITSVRITSEKDRQEKHIFLGLFSSHFDLLPHLQLAKSKRKSDVNGNTINGIAGSSKMERESKGQMENNLQSNF